MRRPLEQLRVRLAEVSDLAGLIELVHWDQEAMMPPRGASVRAEQLATLSRLTHERRTSPEIGGLLDELRPLEESLDPESDDASLIRVARRDFEKAVRVPATLRGELTRAGAHGVEAWGRAREASDFSLFLPHLERNTELRRRYVECFDADRPAYDVLLDDYEEGLTAVEVNAVFDRLKEELRPLLADLSSRDDRVDTSVVLGSFPVDRQRRFALSLVEPLGVTKEGWRLDTSAHPFQSNPATTDIRITTRYDERDILQTVFTTLHECGHGLYEAGVDPALERTPLVGGASMALHESQSRLWENVVGRGEPFWRHALPELQAAFPDPFGRLDLATFLRAINRVQPSLIRIDADELTYNLHIILRFELEQRIVAGKLDLRDLPQAWNELMNAYLGMEVPDDARGVLQDIHWSDGSYGYFPTYTLGNVLSVQIWERARAELPELDGQLERGNLMPLREWLRERLHRHGRKFTPKETIERVAGGPLDPEPYLRYLRTKLRTLG